MNPGVAVASQTDAFARFMGMVYTRMGIGIIVTIAVTLFMTSSPGLMESLVTLVETTNADGEAERSFTASGLWWAAVAIELGIVVIMSFLVNRLSAAVSWPLFLIYAGLNGITLSPLIFAYTGESALLAFVSAIVVFGVAAFYGYTTKKDFTPWGRGLMVGLISLIVVMVANLFIGSSLIAMGVSAVAVVLFTIITVWDVQTFRIMHNEQFGQSEKSLAVFCAFSMYINLVAMFVHLHRLINGGD